MRTDYFRNHSPGDRTIDWGPPWPQRAVHTVSPCSGRYLAKVSNFSLRPNEYAKRLKPRFRPIVPSHWQTQKKIQNFQHLVRRGHYAALSYDVIHDVFDLFTSAKVKMIWFDTFGLKTKVSRHFTFLNSN